MALSRVGQHFSRNFDQYTIMCVFGSVVGCVILPLMAQSLESLIITAILFGVTMKTLKKAPGGNGGVAKEPHGGSHQGNMLSEGGSRKKERERRARKLVQRRGNQQHVSPVVDGETLRLQREQEQQKREEQKLLDQELRNEERRRKKAKKREEKLKRREEERIEKEKELALHRDRQREKERRKKASKSLPLLPTVDMVSSMISEQKFARHERKHSTSSSASSNSSTPSVASASSKKRKPATLPPRMPRRASSAPLMTAPPRPPMSPASSPSPQQVPVSCPPTLGFPTTQLPSMNFDLTPQQQPPLTFEPGCLVMCPYPVLQILGGQRPHPLYGQQPCPSSATPPPNSITDAPREGHLATWLPSRSPPISPGLLQESAGHAPVSKGCGSSAAALGFYSFLNEQALNSDSSGDTKALAGIWSPHHSSSEGVGMEAWPGHVDTATPPEHEGAGASPADTTSSE